MQQHVGERWHILRTRLATMRPGERYTVAQLVGAAMVIRGLWMVFEPAAWIVAGLAVVAIATGLEIGAANSAAAAIPGNEGDHRVP